MSALPPLQIANSLSAKFWLGPYAIAVSTLYLWGYWGSFHINVLEYVSIADIVKAAIYPIASAFAFFAIGAVFGATMSPTLNLPPGGGRNTLVGRLLVKSAPFVIWAYLSALLIYFLLGTLEKWNYLPILFAMAVYFPLKATGVLLADLKSDEARSIAVFLLAALIPFSYGRGVLSANDVLTGKEFAFITSEVPGIQVGPGAKDTERPRYVGKANDRFVFFDPTNGSVSLVAAPEVKTLILKWAKAAVAAEPNSAVASPATSRSSSPSPASAPITKKVAS